MNESPIVYVSIKHKINNEDNKKIINDEISKVKSNITLKKNISLSPFFQCSNKEEFIKVMEEFEDGRC